MGRAFLCGVSASSLRVCVGFPPFPLKNMLYINIQSVLMSSTHSFYDPAPSSRRKKIHPDINLADGGRILIRRVHHTDLYISSLSHESKP